MNSFFWTLFPHRNINYVFRLQEQVMVLGFVLLFALKCTEICSESAKCIVLAGQCSSVAVW